MQFRKCFKFYGKFRSAKLESGVEKLAEPRIKKDPYEKEKNRRKKSKENFCLL
jgi:hypothetical protein